MLLSDIDIAAALAHGSIEIQPPPDELQPSSVDLHLSPVFRRFRTLHGVLDPLNPPVDLTYEDEALVDGRFILRRGEFVLASTVEHVALDGEHVARLEGRSSLGRVGLMIHSTAGYVDPGWHGTLTLELSNIGSMNLALTPGMRICQMSFYQLSSPAARLYGSKGLGSKYLGQTGPTAALKEID